MQVEDSIRGEKTTAEILSLPEKTGIRICEFSFLGDKFGLQMSKDPEIKKASIRYYLDSIRICKQVGAVTAIGYEYKPQNPSHLLPECAEFLRILLKPREVRNEEIKILMQPRIDDYSFRPFFRCRI